MTNRVFLIEVNPDKMLISLKVDRRYVEITNKAPSGDLLGDFYGHNKCIKISKDDYYVNYQIPITGFGSDALDKQILKVTLSLAELSERLFAKLPDKLPAEQPFIFMTGADQTGSFCTLRCLINKNYVYKLSRLTESEEKEVTKAMDDIYWRIFNKPIISDTNYLRIKQTKDIGLLEFCLKTATPLCKTRGPFTLNGSTEMPQKVNVYLGTERSVTACSMDAQMILLVGMITLSNILSRSNNG